MLWNQVALASVLALSSACSVTDVDDIGDIAAGIRDLPPADQTTILVNKENDRLWNIIKNKSATNDRIGIIGCAERDDPKYKNWGRRDPFVTKEWALQELRHNPSWGLAELFAAMLQQFKPGPLGGDPCTPRYEPMPGGWKLEDLRADLDAAEQAEDAAEDSAFWLPTLDAADLTSRPVLMGVLGLALVGGVIVISVSNPVIMALCPKTDAFECPANPLSPGGNPVNPNGVPGGDR